MSDFQHEAAQLNAMLMHALSACVHYQEFFDTNCEHEVDLTSAQMSLQGHGISDWIRDNSVLLPVRRDGKSMLDILDSV